MAKAFKPAKRQGTKNEQFRERIESSLVEAARGKHIEIHFPELNKVKERRRIYKVREEIAFSYGTNDPYVVGMRKCIAESAFRAFINSLKTGVVAMSDHEVNMLANEIHAFYKKQYPDSTGLPSQQKTIEALYDLDYAGLKPLYPILTDPGAETAYYEINKHPYTDAFRADDLSDKAIEFRVGTLCNWYIFLNRERLNFDDRKRVMKRVDQIAHLYVEGISFAPEDISRKEVKVDASQKTATASRVSVAAILERWNSVRKRKYNTYKPKVTATASLNSFLNDKDANSITKDDLVQWQIHLGKHIKPNGEKYADNTINTTYIGSIKTLLTFAHKTGMIDQNNSSAFTIVGNPQNYTRTGYKKDQIGHLIQKVREVEDERIKWIILLVINTGSRVGEIAQLGEDQVHIEKKGDDGQDLVWIDIKPSRFGGTLKNFGSRRQVPLVSKIIGPEFLAFCASRKDKPLFFDYDPERDALSAAHDAVTKRTARWINKTVSRNSDQDPHHAARHFIQTHGPALDISMDLIESIVGHKRKGMRGRYTPYDFAKKLEALRKIFAFLEE